VSDSVILDTVFVYLWLSHLFTQISASGFIRVLDKIPE